MSAIDTYTVEPRKLLIRLGLGASLMSLCLAAPSMALAGPIDLPSGGVSSMTIDNGSDVTATDVTVGNAGTADLTVTGSGSSLTATGNVRVGVNGGAGTLLLSDQAAFDADGGLTIGSDVGSVGNMTVTGAGTSFSAGSGIAIGDYGGQGSLTINNGATFDLPNGSIYLGAHGGNGKLAIDGAGTVVSVDGNLSTGCIQTTADCRVDITNGAKLLMTGDETGGFVATGPGQNSTVRLSGAGTEWSGIRWFYVGYNQDADTSPNIGTLIIEDGAVARRDRVVDPTTMAGSVGSFAAGVSEEDTGNVIVRGAGSELSSIYNMYVNYSGTGNFEVYDGGKISAGSSVPVNNGGTLGHVLGGLRFYSNKGTLNIGGTVDGPARGAGFIDAENIIFRTPVDGLSGGTLVLNHTNSDYEISSNLLSFGSTALVPPEDIGLGITERGGKIVAVAGDTTFSGNGAGFYGLLDLRGGTVRVTGSLGPLSKSVVGNTGFLTGTGSVGSATVKSGGVIGGGGRAAVGTLSLGGDLAIEDGGKVRVRFDDASANDVIDVNGDADFAAGSLLSVEKLPGGWIDLANRHLVMSIDGSRTGELTGGSGMVLSNFYGLSIAYDQAVPGGQTLVYLDPTQIKAYADVAGITRNQRAVANALQGMNIRNPVVNAVAMLPDDASAARAYDDLSGAVYADAPVALTEELSGVSDVLVAKAAAERGTGKGVDLWVTGFGRESQFEDDGNAHGLTAKSYGLLAGADMTTGDGFSFGGALGVSNGSSEVDDDLGSTDANTIHGGLYAGYTVDGFSLLAGGNVASSNVSASRNVDIGTFSDSLDDDVTLTGGALFGEVSYRQNLSERAYAEPFARFTHVATQSADVSESGGAAALDGKIESSAQDYASLGLRVAASANEQTPWGIDGTLGYRRLLGGDAATASLSMDGGQNFVVDGWAQPENVGFVDVGLEGRIGASATVRLNYAGNLGEDYWSQSVGATLSWRL